MINARVSELNTSFQSNNILRDLFPEVLTALNSAPIDFKESGGHKLDTNFQDVSPSSSQPNLKQPINHFNKRTVIDLTREASTHVLPDKIISTPPPSLPIQLHFDYDLPSPLIIPSISRNSATTFFPPPAGIYSMACGYVSPANYDLYDMLLPFPVFYPLHNQKEYLNNWHSEMSQSSTLCYSFHQDQPKKRKLPELPAVKANKKQIEESIERVEDPGKRLLMQSMQQPLSIIPSSYFSNLQPRLKELAERLTKCHFSYEQVSRLVNSDNAIEKLKKLEQEHRVLNVTGFKHQQTVEILSSKDGLKKISILLECKCTIKMERQELALQKRDLYIEFITKMLTAEDGLENFSHYMQIKSSMNNFTIKQNSSRFFKSDPAGQSKDRIKSFTGVSPNQPKPLMPENNRLLTLRQRGVNSTNTSSTFSSYSSVLASSSFLNNLESKKAVVIKKEEKEEKQNKTIRDTLL